MKLPAPRVIAIDDVQEDLDALTRALNSYGAACLPIHFSGDDSVVPRCPAVRVIFADLHLLPGHTEDATQQFSVIASLIQRKIKPSGAYLVILWTRYPEEASACREFLHERLEVVSKPFAVVPLDKSEYLDDKRYHSDVGPPNPGKSLEGDIEHVVLGLPHVAALLNWEERALEASAATVGAIQSLAVCSAGADDPEKEFASLLQSLATAAAGKHAAADPFQAVTGALLPILADRLATIPSNDDALWRSALKGSGTHQKLDLETAARLNRLLHFAPPEAVRGDERGAVIALPVQYRGDAFEATFGLCASKVAENQFARRELDDAKNSDVWVMVQCQAACDYAQEQPGPVPFQLGLLVPNEQRSKKGRPPAALWQSPCFDLDSEICFLHVNARFSLSLPRSQAKAGKPLFRLREQLLNQLIYVLHSYGARPGIVRFP